MSDLAYYPTAERPDIRLWLTDDDGTLVNLTGHTCVLKLGEPGAAAVLTKTTGMTVGAGSGTETSGTPDLTISFSPDEPDAPAAGLYRWQVRATSGSSDRFWQGDFRLEPIIS